MEVDKNKQQSSLGNEEVEKAVSETVGPEGNESVELNEEALNEAQQAVSETLNKILEEKESNAEHETPKEANSSQSVNGYKKLEELSEAELKQVEARLAARLDNWADDEDEALEEVLKSFLALSQWVAAGLLAICSLIPKLSIIAGSWYQGLFVAFLLLVSGLFVKKIYWAWAPFCSLILTLALSFFFMGKVVHFYHKDGFLAFLSISFTSLIGLSTLVILWRIYKNKSMEL